MVWIMNLPDDILPDTCIINFKNGEWCVYLLTKIYIFIFYSTFITPAAWQTNVNIFLWSDHYINLGEHLQLWDSVLCDICDTQQIEQEFDVILQCPHFTNLLTKYLREY